MDIKPTLPIQNSGGSNNHVAGRPDDLGKNGGLTDIKLQVNGTLDLDDNFNLLQSKDMKQEPLDDTSGIESSDTSLSNHNKLFSDINLNDQEWQELIDELANTVPEDDMHDLFNEDFEEKREAEFTRPAAQTPLPQEPPPHPPPPPQSIKNDPARSPFSIPMGSPQVRPSSSGPQFTTASSSTPPHQQPPPVSMAVGSPANCVARSPQTPNQAQAPRPGNGFLMNQGPGVVTGPSSGVVAVAAAVAASGQGGGIPVPSSTPDLSPAEQLKQMAAQQQQRAKLMQQKQQQQQQQQTPAPNWSPAGPPTSPYGGAFNPDKPNSPMMYPQAFNNQNPMVPPMTSNPQKATMNNYLPQNHMNMISQQPNSMGQNTMSKQQAAMLSYSNTKPLTHFSALDHMGQRMTPPMANPNKNPMMPYIQQQQAAQQQQQQQQVPPQAQVQMSTPTSHLSEEQKRILLLKHKGLLNQSMSYSAMQPHNQEQNAVGISRQAGCVQPSLPGPGSVASVPSTNPGAPGYLGNQQQAAMMKQMIMEQEKQRVQLHLMEQQKQQRLLREQRQQQQHQLLAEQQLQQQHLPRQLPQQQRNPYPVQQVNQFQGTPQEIARNQALQNIRNARILQQQQQQQQSQGILQMASVHNSGTMSTATGQAEMSMAYNNAPSGQQGMYGINPAMNQMLQHPNQSSMNMAHNPSQGQRQPIAGQGVVGGYGQGMLINSAMSQQQPPQQMKGPPVGQAIPKAQAQRLQMMGGTVQGAQGWQQQGMPGRTSGEMMTFNNSSAYAMQPGQPRMTKQHFPQAMSQSIVDPTGNIRTMNPAMGGQMMPHMSGQPRTNQSRPMVMAGMSQGVPNMNAFSQGPGQQIGGGGVSFLHSGQPQGYQRTASQDLSFSYSHSAGGGSFSSLADGADLVDSLIKGSSTDEWIDEILGNQQ
ncbi:mastermind-like protein 3 isoform X3 [Polyodon spathula]|nr:mastermind-like protein 3 isoform X3 [Polyodon spathula]